MMSKLRSAFFPLAILVVFILLGPGCSEKETGRFVSSSGAQIEIFPPVGVYARQQEITLSGANFPATVSSIRPGSILVGPFTAEHTEIPLKDGSFGPVRVKISGIMPVGSYDVSVGGEKFPGAYRIKPVTVVYMMWGTTDEYDTVKKYIEKFNEKFPGIKVDIQHVPGSYNDKLQTMIAAGTPPDVMYIGKDEFPMYANRGVLLNLESYIARDDDFRKEDFFPILMEQFEFEGNCYGIPKDFTPIVLYYNRDMFDKAGLEYPTGDWTWEDFLAAAKALTIDSDGDGRIDQYGFIADLNRTFWAPWVWQNGGALITPDHKKWLLADPQYIDANAEALQFYYDLIYKHGVAPKPSITMDMGCADMFSSGRVAMATYGRWVCMSFKHIKQFKWDVSLLPHGKQRANTICTVCYSISSKCKHPDAAWELVKFLTGPEGQIATARSGQAVPSMISIAYSDHFLKCEILPPINNRVYLEAVKYSRPLPVGIYAAQIDDVFKMEFDLFFKTGRPVRETLREAQRGLQQFLER